MKVNRIKYKKYYNKLTTKCYEKTGKREYDKEGQKKQDANMPSCFPRRGDICSMLLKRFNKMAKMISSILGKKE